MKISTLSTLFLVFSLVPIISHADEQLYTFSSGDEQLVISDIGDGELGYSPMPSVVEEQQPSSAGGGGSTTWESSISKSKYYDIYLKLQKDNYNKGESVIAEILIINKRVYAGENVSFIYYLSDSVGQVYSVNLDTIDVIPSSTASEDECESQNGIIDNQTKGCILPMQLSTQLPLSATTGSWRFNMEVKDPEDVTIRTYKSFKVGSIAIVLVVIGLISTMVLVMVKKGMNKKKEQQEEDNESEEESQ